MASSPQSVRATGAIPHQADRGSDESRQPLRTDPEGRSRLLVVDDDEAIREIISAMLTEQGYEIVTAGDGRQALELTRQFRPHLVVTDLRMPGMAGDELVRVMRERFPQLPVIVVSGEFLADEFLTSVPADAFIPKGGCFITALEVKITQLLSRPELNAR
ncbi:MAG: response regulator [Acidobacteriota bacterium]